MNADFSRRAESNPQIVCFPVVYATDLSIPHNNLVISSIRFSEGFTEWLQTQLCLLILYYKLQPIPYSSLFFSTSRYYPVDSSLSQILGT
jgi:hypothetical protein